MSIQSNIQSNAITHASYCRDPDCEGCDVGQVELDLPEEVLNDPLQLWELAQSEILRETPSSDSEDDKGTSNSRETVELDDEMQDAVVTKLLDLAIEQFENFERDHTTAEAIGYGRCLVERGKILDSPALVDKGISVLEARLTSSPDISEAATTWAVIGKARIEQVCARITDANTVVLSDDSDHDLLDSDDEEEAVGTSTNAVATSKALLQHGIACIEKGLELRLNEDAIERAKLSLCRHLTDAAAMIRSRSQADLALHLVNNAALLARPYIFNPSDLHVHWHAILGKNYFFTARIGRWILRNQAKRGQKGLLTDSPDGVVNGASFDDIRTLVDSLQKISSFVDYAISQLIQALEGVQQDRVAGKPIPKRSWIVNVDYHLGQASLLKSSLPNTPDDVAVDAYEDGIRSLLRCLENDPSNNDIRQQLEAMGALDNIEEVDDDQDEVTSNSTRDASIVYNSKEEDELSGDAFSESDEGEEGDVVEEEQDDDKGEESSASDRKHDLANGTSQESEEEDVKTDRPSKRRKPDV